MTFPAHLAIARRLAAPGWTDADMTGWPEGDPAKVKLVAAVRTQTNIPPAWMAPHLVMGSWTQSLKSARLVAEAGTFEKLALPLVHVCFSSG